MQNIKASFAILILAYGSYFFSCKPDKQPVTPVSGTQPDTTTLPQKPAKPEIIPGKYIVLIKESIAEPAILNSRKEIRNRSEKFKENELKRRANLKVVDEIISNYKIKKSLVKQYYADLLVGFSAELTPAEVKLLQADPHVKGVFPDVAYKFQQGFAWQTFGPESFEPFEVQRAVAMAGGPVDGSGKDTWIWVIDSGIDLDHPDLNVQTDEPFAISFTSSTPEDDYGHGTIVAGLAAAKNNNFGTCGVSSGAKVVPVKVGQPGFISGYGAQVSSILAGLDHVAKFYIPDDVVNISIASYEGEACANGTSTLNEQVKNAVELLGWAGVWVCSGAGNEGDCNGSEKNLPACINGYKVLTIAAITAGGNCSDFNWGNTVDWAACGSATSTYLSGQYAPSAGTSLSTPIVAGIIHARGAAPVSAAEVTCCDNKFKVAHFSTLNTLKFDVELKLVRFDIQNVRDLDATEDLFGRIIAKKFSTAIIANDADFTILNETLWEKTAENALHSRNGTVNINKTIRLANNISFDQLRNIRLVIGGTIKDEERPFGPRSFKCQECKNFDGDDENREIKFMQVPSALASINNLEVNGLFQDIKFGNDRFFELNFYESDNKNDGWVKVLFKVFVRARPVANPACQSCHAQGI